MPSNNPEYASAYQKKWYRDNKAKHIAACNSRRDKVVLENQRKIVEYLSSHSCVDCGETDIVVLQFDHVREKKYKEIGSMMACTWNTLEREIAKCDVRCANCHTRRTAQTVNNYRVQWVAGVRGNIPPF